MSYNNLLTNQPTTHFNLQRYFCIVIILLSLSSRISAQSFPANFSSVLVANGISRPTSLAFAPDGRIFITEQDGDLMVIKNGNLLSRPFVSLTVNSSGERGLLGIAIDPGFSTNRYIYLYYTLSSAVNNRISRFTASGDTVVPGSEVVILDLDPLSSATNHNGGNMQFGLDGKLYVGIGENANSAYSQNLDTYHGKIIRINKDGSIPSGNPFTTGSEQKKRIWSYGLRNPFTLSVQPLTGKIYVNDVGQNVWEEINDASTGGLNYGWPTAEGESTNSTFTNPVYSYGHGTSSGLGCAISGGTFFNPSSTTYPTQYIGSYFYMDYCEAWIDRVTVNGSNVTRSAFATGLAGSPLALTVYNGILYYLSRNNGALYKIEYYTSAAPVIASQPQNVTVSAGQAASFSVTATGSAPLSYQWRKNNVNISGATGSTYTKTSVVPADTGLYKCVVTNTAGSTTSNTAKLTVIAPNSVPVATITTPVTGAKYSAGTTISFSGSATDAEDGILAANVFTWYVLFYHDTHSHPGPTAPSGVKNGTFSIPNTGETSSNVFYRLYLVVHDAQGATDTAYTDILPRKTSITLNTNPQGLQITLDGQPFTAPLTFTSVEGMLRTIGGVTPQTINNALTYTFSNWLQGGNPVQTFATPANQTSYTANYSAVLRLPENPAYTTNGLEYSYYEGYWNKLPDFAALTPVNTDTVANFYLSPRARDNKFGFSFTGYISIPVDGIYTFYTSSDDGSKLFIGNTMVVNNDSIHTAQEKSGKIGLKAGKHAVSVNYFDQTGSQSLIVSYESSGITKRAIPSAVLYRDLPFSFYNLLPVADSYVRTGNYRYTVFGNDTLLVVKKSDTIQDYYRETFLRFNISGIGNIVNSATLKLFGSINVSTSDSVQIEARNINNQQWQESTITFANRPVADNLVYATETISGTSARYYEWDVTSLVQARKNLGADKLSISLRALTEITGSGNRVVFKSKESSSDKPVLVINASAPLMNPEEVNKSIHPIVNNTENNFGIIVSPNPASNELVVYFSKENEKALLKISDLNGKVVNEKSIFSGQNQLSVDKLTTGVYFLSVQTSMGVLQKKLMIIR